MRIASLLLSVIVIGLSPGASALAQSKSSSKSRGDAWKTDPYTKNDPAIMAKAGYVSFGPFSWGDNHDSARIQKLLVTRQLLFVETAHFKICSALPPYLIPRQKLERKLLTKELRRLKKVFPKIKVRAKTLDPWLRLHLFAMRVEDTYARFCKQAGVTDSDFKEGSRPRVVKLGSESTVEKNMGRGEFIGMRGKFLIMILKNDSDLKRYVAMATDKRRLTGAPRPRKLHYLGVGSLFFGTSCENGRNSLGNDLAMRCHIAFNTAQTLIDGFKDFRFRLPVWCREGIAHWYSRDVDPSKQCFTEIKGRDEAELYEREWAVKTRRRVKNGDFEKWSKLSRFMQFNELNFRDHMASWSRIDFLLSQGEKKFARYLDILKADIVTKDGSVPTKESVWAQQEHALKSVYGLDDAGFDTAWSKFVVASYPRK